MGSLIDCVEYERNQGWPTRMFVLAFGGFIQALGDSTPCHLSCPAVSYTILLVHFVAAIVGTTLALRLLVISLLPLLVGIFNDDGRPEQKAGGRDMLARQYSVVKWRWS